MAKKILQDAIKLLNTGKEIHVFKGLMMKPEKTMKDDGTWYWTFDLKCLKNFSSDAEYGQSYNLFHMLIPSDMAQDFTDKQIEALSENEIFVCADTRCSVRASDKGKFNNISFYVKEIELSRQVINSKVS